MTEDLIEIYGNPNSAPIFHLFYNNGAKVDKKIASEYLKKYGLTEEDYFKTWKPIQDSIFQNQDQGLPAMVFKPGFSLIAIRGGAIFERRDFKKLQYCMQQLGDTHLIIIENDLSGMLKVPPFRMVYPADITWREIMSGNFISTAIFEMDDSDYFIFSNRGSWGKYLTNDYIYSIDIIGFKHEYATLFREAFNQSEREKNELRGWLPPNYRDLTK
jgi:hypothetical protein